MKNSIRACFRVPVMFLLALIVAISIGHAQGAPPVKKSGSGICHCPGGSYYDRTTKFTPFQTIDECLASGGRHPKRGQGDCNREAQPEAMAPATPSAESSTGMIRPGVRVVDGDTIDVNGTRIRFQGIDTPETGQACRDAAGNVYACGLVATAALTLKIGQVGVRCELDAQFDRYGRALGNCYGTDGTDLSGWLVRNGYGLAYRRYSERYVDEEEAAIAEGAGMHAGDFVPPWDWRRGERLQ